MADRHALVFGASGIAGWGTLKAFSEDSSFASVIGTTLRKLDEIGIPNGKKIKLVSGIDLSKEKEEVRKMLRDIPGIENVTHVYWGAFLPNQNVEQRVALNTKMFKTTVTLVDELCPNLQFFLHQTGSMYYGLEYMSEIEYTPPFLESRSRIPPPFYDKIYYYPQLDWMASYSSGKKWKWADSRPDLISGFVPTGGFMNFLGPLCIYLATYRQVNGAKAKVKFPGSEAGWKSKFNGCDQNLLGRFHVWLSTLGEKVNGQSYNVADNDETSWSYIFPKIAEWFDLEAVAPDSGEDGGAVAFEWWQNTGSKAYAELAKEKGLKEMPMGEANWGFLRACTSFFTLDRQLDVSKVRALGWKETQDPAKGYLDALDQSVAYGVIPSPSK